MNSQESAQITNLIKHFVFNTIVGSERGMFKTFQKLEVAEMLKSESTLHSIKHYLIEYFNSGYRALIYSNNGEKKREEDKDEYYQEQFGQMHAIKNHSYICLLNMVFAIAINIESMFDRLSFDITSLEAFENSVRLQFIIIFGTMKEKLIEQFNHECDGMDITTCDPEEELFFWTKDPNSTQNESDIENEKVIVEEITEKIIEENIEENIEK